MVNMVYFSEVVISSSWVTSNYKMFFSGGSLRFEWKGFGKIKREGGVVCC